VPDIILDAALNAGTCAIRSRTSYLAHIYGLEVRQFLVGHDQMLHPICSHQMIEFFALEVKHTRA